MSSLDLASAESISTTNASYFILVYIIILVYCCFGLAIVCDAYFVPALQKLSDTYNLPPDIAGSTLMALGASIPELFASLIGVFVTQDDIGTGSIIGSSCFNLIAVPAACAFIAASTFDRKLTLNPTPIIRNSLIYGITILVLVLIIKDNCVDIPEALILLLFFILYVGIMIYSAKATKDKEGTESINLNPHEKYYSNPLPLIYQHDQHHYHYYQLQEPTHQAINFASDNYSADNTFDTGFYLDLKKYSDEKTPLVSDFQHENWVSSRWILIPMLPLTLGLNILTPCKFKNTFWTIWTFLVSISLIGALTYISIWMVHMSSRVVGLPETIAGMTILSWGTGVPELIASIVLIKKTAQADMAICNTIGSNVIDVSFCLSVPW